MARSIFVSRIAGTGLGARPRDRAEDRHEHFRHWFMWEAIGDLAGKIRLGDYDRMMDLAAQNGIKVVVAELNDIGAGVGLRKISPCAFQRQRRFSGEQRHFRLERHRRFSRTLPR